LKTTNSVHISSEYVKQNEMICFVYILVYEQCSAPFIRVHVLSI